MAKARIFYQQDCDINVLKGKRVAIIGYGSQGHAHALNLKESGVDVVVGLYEGSKSWAKAEQQGLTVMTTEEAAKTSDDVRYFVVTSIFQTPHGVQDTSLHRLQTIIDVGHGTLQNNV